MTCTSIQAQHQLLEELLKALASTESIAEGDSGAMQAKTVHAALYSSARNGAHELAGPLAQT